jgi:protein required for attachment to host cells
MKPTITWIVVADGARARIFVNRGPGKGLELSGSELTAEHQRTSDMVRDSLPRTHEAVGHARHAIEPRSDPHQDLKRQFTEHLAQVLDQSAAEKAFDRFVIVAPPKVLGDFRKAISKRLQSLLHTEVAKDLTKATAKEVADHLAETIII